MSEPIINRIYDLKISGYDDSIQQVEALTNAFLKMDETKRKLNSQLQEKLNAGDSDAVTQLTAKIKDLETEMAKLKTQRDSAAKEQALLAKAEKDQADAYLKTQKAAESLAKTEQIRTSTAISQEKELDRQIALEEKQAQQLAKEKQAADAAAGSYVKLKEQRSQLESFTGRGNQNSTFNFEGNTIGYDEAIAKIKEIKAQEQQYLDQLKIEKESQAAIVKGLQDKITQTKIQRLELQKVVSNSDESSSLSFNGQSLNITEAISKINELSALETQYTEKLNNENAVRQNILKSQQESINSTRSQITQLQSLTSNNVNNSSINFNGENLSQDSAILKIKELQEQERIYTEQLNVEKNLEVQINAEQNQKINSLKTERTELESLVQNAQKQTSLSVNGKEINYTAAIEQISQLKAAETQLTQNLATQGVETKALANNYYGLLEAQRQAINLYRNTPFDSPIFLEVKQQAMEATAQVQAFNRSLSPDGTLVGEYKTGILNAFKDLGLTDVIKAQRNEINEQLQAIKQQAQDLANQYKQTSSESAQSLQKIDQQLQLNMERQDQLKKQLQTVGEVGSVSYQEITNSLRQTAEQQEVLASQYKQTSIVASESLSKVDQQLRQTIEQQERMKQSLSTIDAALAHTGSVGSQISSGIAEGFKNVRAQVGQMVVAYVGFQAIFQGALNLLHTNTELTDSIAQLQIYIHGTTEEANNLVDALKKIPTRTSLPNLVDIATSVAQKGVAKEQIGEVTQAFDELFTALGKDAGDPHQGVLTIAKLISIFHDDHEVTAQRVKELGNAMFTLQSSGPVSGEFLQGYAERVGAVRSITGATIPEILGMAAGFQQLGQTEEVAGSASSRLLTQLIGNVEKFAAISGISVEKLRAVIKVNPFEGLLEVAEKLKDKGAEGVEQIVKLVGELPGLNNVRVRGAFSELINNADLFRAKMEQAGTSLNTTAGLTTAFEEKQKTFGATIAEIGKAFQVAFSNENFLNVLNQISKVLLGIIQVITAIPFSVVVGGITAMSAAWLFYKGNLTLARLEQSANNEATLLGYVRLNLLKSGLFGAAAAEQARAASVQKTNAAVVLKIASINSEIASETAAIAALEARVAADAEQSVVLEGEIAARRAHIIALEGEISALEGATLATDGLNVATKASPLGIILGIIALIVPVMSAFGKSTNNATKEISEQNSQLRLNKEIQGEVAKSVVDSTQTQITHVTQLIAVLKDHTSETYLLKKAYDALIAIAPEFAGVYDGEKVNLEKLNELYPIYIANLKAVSEAKALSSIRDKFAQEKADAEVAAFQAKLKADQEKTENDQIEKNNKKLVATPAFGGAGIGGSSAAVPLGQTSDVAQKEYEQKQAAVKKAAEQSAGLDAYLKNDLQERQKRIADLTAELSKLKTGTEQYNKIYSQLQTEKKNLEVVAGIPEAPPQTSLGIGGRTIAEIKADLKKANEDFEHAVNGSPEKAELEKKIAALKQELIDAGGAKGKTSVYKGSRLTGDQKDLFKDIDAAADQEITQEKLKFAQLQEDEETYLKNILQINTDAANKKIALLKGNNAEERKQIAQQKLFIIDQENETNKKLFDLQKKQLDANLAANKTQAQISLDKINADPNKTDQDKRKAKADFLAEEYLLESVYDVQINNLETKYNQKSVENAQKRKDSLLQITQSINKADFDIAVGTLQAIDDATDKNITEIKLKYDKLVQQILASSQSTENKTAAITILTKTENVETGGVQLKGDVSKVLAAKQLLDFGLITKKQFEDIYAAANEGQKKLNNAIEDGKNSITSMSALLGNSLGNLFGFGKESGQAQLLAQTITAGFDTAKEAMNSYFDAEQNNIQHSNQITQKRLDLELQQAKSKAQSQAEQDSLDQQFQAKKEAADKAAFEKNKKLQIEQAKINLAIQLSNLAVIAFAPNPLNIATLGVAGTIMYAIQAALAIANYAMNVSKIKSAQYAAAGGGKIPKLTAGKITHPSNIPTQPNGDDILATVKTDEVILNKEQQRKAGGDPFFKKLGVPGFAEGGNIRAFASGGYTGIGYEELGSSLKAPVNPQSYLAGGASSSAEENNRQIAALTGLIKETGRQVHQRIDKLEVILDPVKVEKANNKTKKATAIGNL